MDIAKICPECGKEFIDSKHPYRQRFCSRECLSNSYYETVNCPGCDISFRRLKSRGNKYCSAACGFEHRPKPPRTRVATYTCEWCNKSFEGWMSHQNRFCSRQCSSEYGGRQIGIKTSGKVRKPENYVTICCEQCGKEYLMHKNVLKTRKSRFCSRECRDAALVLERTGELNPMYSGGTKYPNRGANWFSQRHKALKRDGYKCQICGYKKQKGKSRHIDVHHIIPYAAFDGDFLQANQLSNLITLCRNCHIHVERHGLPCPKPLL